MSGSTNGTERAPEPVERFVRQLLVTNKAVKLYPPASDIPRQSTGDLLNMLRGLLRERPELRFQVAKDRLIYGGLPVLPDQPAFSAFAREFYNRGLSEVRFHAGATSKEVIEFLRALQAPPEEIAASGGFEQRLWDQQVDGVTVREVSARVIDAELTAETPASGEESWPPPHERIDEIVEAAYGARPRDQRMLVRFVQNPRLVSSYLRELASTGRGGRPLVNFVAGRIVSLAHAMMNEIAEEQPELLRSVAEAVLGLDPDLRREIFLERLLPEARMDEGLAALLQQYEVGELCKALVEGVGADEVSRDGLARAIRNLAAIAVQPREDVIAAAAAAMKEAGFDGATTAAVLENAAPRQLRARPAPESRGESVESVLRLVDLAPIAPEAVGAEVGGLLDEVADGISDGDVLLAIVSLVTLERRPEMFASLMAIVEDGLGLLLEWGEYAAAADAAESLVALQGDDALDSAQHDRIAMAIEAMASPRYMREVAAAMRVHNPQSTEYSACRRLLATLGANTIGPLLEVLADEPDMAARKALVDLVSDMASNQIESLGARLSDPRWYFVRNVVNILGSTRDPTVLAPLSRTLRHADARVRRETIRAVGGVRVKYAEEMLVSALADDDGQNVALAARTLGSLGVVEALPALIEVAQGEGRGSRDAGARIEAIEALGRLGRREALPALRELERQRGLMRGGRAREIRTAAESALAAIARSAGGGGA